MHLTAPNICISDKMKIRTATKEDKEAIFSLVRASWHDNFAESICYFHDSLTFENSVFSINKYFDKWDKILVAEDKGKIIGASIVSNLLGRVFLFEIFVSPEYQQKGVGTALIQESIKGYNEIWTFINENNIASQKLFTKFDFKKIETDYVYQLKSKPLMMYSQKEILIRSGTLADKEAVFQLIRNNWDKTKANSSHYSYNQEGSENFIKNSKYWWDECKLKFVAEKNNKIIGFITAFHNHINNFLFDKKFENELLPLITTAIQGFDNIIVLINAENYSYQKLFESLGFKKIVTGSVWKLEK